MADNWTVVGQRQTTDFGPDGRFAEVMEVTFRVTSSGVTGRVLVPLNLYSADYVASRIEDYVANIEAVHNL